MSNEQQNNGQQSAEHLIVKTFLTFAGIIAVVFFAYCLYQAQM